MPQAMLLVVALVLAGAMSQTDDLRDAARRGDRDAVTALLEGGADVNGGNRYGATALFFAAEKGDLPMVELLVEHGARVDGEDSFYEMTALSRALFGGHFDVVTYLLERGAPGADTALRVAAESGELSLAKAAFATGSVTGAGYDEARAAALSADHKGIDEWLTALARPTQPIADSGAAALSGDALQALTGRYQNDALGQILVVELDDDGLMLRGSPSGRLTAASGRVFALEGEDIEVSFAGRGGMVERLVVERGSEATSYRPIDEAESREAAPMSPGDVVSPSATASSVRGEPMPWPGFRGPNGSGVADGQALPVAWSEDTGSNIRFKTAIPGFSVASPIVWGSRIFVATAISGAGDETFRTGLYGDVAPIEDLSEHRWLLFGIDAVSGDIVWEQELHRGVPGTKRHSKSSQVNATPVTDGERVITVLGAVGVIYCHDFSGKLLWKKDIGVRNVGWFYDPDYQWGHSSSPILYDGTVILQSDAHNGSFLAAFRTSDGEELWRTSREEEIPTFSTPAIYRGADGDELITNGTIIRGYDPKTGALLWHLGPNSEIPIGVPVVSDDLIYVTAGYPPIRPIYAIRPGSRGDLAMPEGVQNSEALAWSKNRGGTYIPSPLVYQGMFYTNANNGRLTAYDAASGERVYRARIGGVGGSYAASPIASDGRLYFTNEEGETFVVRAGASYELLSKNTVNGTVLSTPAASNGLLVIRTLTHVYGISE